MNKIPIFRLNFSLDTRMYKLHYFNNKFSKIAKRLSAPSAPLDSILVTRSCVILAKLWFFKLIMTKSNFNNAVMMSFQ